MLHKNNSTDSYPEWKNAYIFFYYNCCKCYLPLIVLKSRICCLNSLKNCLQINILAQIYERGFHSLLLWVQALCIFKPRKFNNIHCFFSCSKKWYDLIILIVAGWKTIRTFLFKSHWILLVAYPIFRNVFKYLIWQRA